MPEYLMLWWVWISVALALGVIELLAPGFIFLGFAIGALAMSALVAAVSGGWLVLPWLSSAPALLAVFAIFALISWIVLKLLFRKQSSGARIVTDDINEN